MANRQRVFDELYGAHHQSLHAYFLGKTSDAELALDLTQDAFLRAWRNIGTLEALSSERQRAWLFTVARNLVVDAHRARATRKSMGDALATQANVGDLAAPAADSNVARRERIEALELAIQRLPEDLRVVLVLQVLGERTSAEIGEVLEIPAGTVRYQQAEARRRLARDLRLMEVLNQ